MKYLLQILLIIVVLAFSANAATYTVTTTADSGAGSLRAAIASANASIEADTITFALPTSDIGCHGVDCQITLFSGELALNSAATAGALTITNSTGRTNLSISGNNSSRVFFVNSGAIVAITGLTISDGNGFGTLSSFNNYGGGIFNSGGNLSLSDTLIIRNSAGFSGGGIYTTGNQFTLTNSTVNNNKAFDRGGGIYNGGIATVSNSIISSNAAYNDGGGIFTDSSNTGYTLYLSNSTIHSNTANEGGGIYIFFGIADVKNSTISDNTSSGRAGGIYNGGGTLNLTSVTVTKNKTNFADCSFCAGGIRNEATANLRNTIVAGNTAVSSLSAPDFFGRVSEASSYNLIGNALGTIGVSHDDANHNQVGFNPLLDPVMKPNGGTTPNYALLPGSPAIDKGNSFGLTTDQHGFRRPFDNPNITNATGGDGADIGAFEVQAAPTAATATVSGYVRTPNGEAIGGITIGITDHNGTIREALTDAQGYYQFEDVQTGETYVLSATRGNFTFTQPTQVISLTDAATIDFTGENVRVKSRTRVFQ